MAQAYHGGNVNEKWQTALDTVKDYDGGSQLVLVKSWPGPFSMYRCFLLAPSLSFIWKTLVFIERYVGDRSPHPLAGRIPHPGAHA